MEAQYGLQKKKAMVPLKVQEGYEADGWLGLMLGTSLWYALYGETLSSESAFEDRMSALSCELGVRGRADAVVAADAPEPCPEMDESEDIAALRSELEGMRLRALERRALSDGVLAGDVDDAMDGDERQRLTDAYMDVVRVWRYKREEADIVNDMYNSVPELGTLDDLVALYIVRL